MGTLYGRAWQRGRARPPHRGFPAHVRWPGLAAGPAAGPMPSLTWTSKNTEVRVNAVLLRASELARAGFRAGSWTTGAPDLTESLFLTQSQADAAKGEAGTPLPPLITRPQHWPGGADLSGRTCP